MGILTQAMDILHAVACRCAGAITRSTYIHSICSMVDSSHAALEVLGWR